MSESKSLSTRTFWNATGSLAATFSRMISAIVIARQLGPELAGTYAFFAWLVEFILVVVTFGLPNTITRYIAEISGKGDLKTLRQIIRWIVRRYFLSMPIGMIIIFVVLTNRIQNRGDLWLILILAILLFFQALSTLITSYLAGMQEYKKIAKLNLITGIALLLLQPAFTSIFGLKGALLATALGYTLSTVWLKPLLHAAFSRSKSSVPESLSVYAAYTWLAAIVSAIVWARAELFFLTQYSTTIQAGYFSVGLTLVGFVTFGAGILTGALLPHFSTMVGSGEKGNLQRDYTRLTTIVALFAFPASLGAAVLMPVLILHIYGPAYAGASDASAVLMLTGIFAFAGTGSSLVYAHGKSDFVFKWGLLGVALVGIGGWFVTPLYGALGVAWVRFGVQTLMICIGTTFIHIQLRIIPPYGALFKLILAALASAIVAKTILIYVSVLPITLATVSACLAYVLMLRIVKPFSSADANAIINLTRKLPVAARERSAALIRLILI